MFGNKNVERINEFIKLCEEIGIKSIKYYNKETELCAYFGRKKQIKHFFEVVKPTIKRKYLKLR